MDCTERWKRGLVCWLVLVCAPMVCAQSGDQGTIEGIIIDPSGAAIAGVTVSARNVETAAQLSTTTNEDGLFRFPVLSVGRYELSAQGEGFARLLVKDVVVAVGARVSLTLSLVLAEKSESVVVSGATPIIETTRSAVTSTVDDGAIAGLPVNGRDFTRFTLLTPGVTRDVRGGLSFAGQRAMNSLLVDGVNSDGTYYGQSTGFSPGPRVVSLFSQEAVQEFQVNSNSYSAEFGRAGGGVVNVVTKSGTNEVHGSGFWFYRDQSMNANDPVNKLNAQPRDPFHFNQFGGVVGGPLIRNRLFFLGNYEGVQSNIPNAVILNLPASFRVSSDPTIAGFQQRALDYLRPRAVSWVRPFTGDVWFTKLDWHLSPAHLLTARWNRYRSLSSLSTGAQNSFEHGGGARADRDTLGGALASTLSSSLVNVARFTYFRGNVPFLSDGVNPEADIFELGQRVLTIGRENFNPQESSIRHGQWLDTLSYARGRHSLQIGGDVLFDRTTDFQAPFFSGSYRFNSLESFGRSLAGSPSPQSNEFYQQGFSGHGTAGSTTHPDILAFAAFVQDEWRVRPNLTLNLGLRYDLQLNAKPPVRNPAPELAAAGLDTSTLPTDKNNFAPRFGLAWSPLANQRLVVRSGYGIFYALHPSIMTSRAHFQNGISVQTRTFFAGTPTAALIPAYPNNFCGAPDPSGRPPSCALPSAGAVKPTIQLYPRDFTQPYVQQGSLGVEVKVEKDLAISASYLMAKGTHLQRVRDVNRATPTSQVTIGIAGTSTVLSFQRFTLPQPIATFDRILLFESSASSIYHGLVVQATKRFSHNFQFLGSYTLGKVIDDNPNVYALGVGAANALLVADPSNPSADRGPGSNDQRHRFVLSGVWQLNYASRLPPLPRTILGGWELSAILTAQSGQPYSGLVSFDLNNDGNFATDRTPGLGRNTFYPPATVSLDPRVTRVVRLTERCRLQFAWEAFNVFNHANITAVRTTQFSYSMLPVTCGVAGTPCLVPQNTGLSAFGTPTATSGPRIMQLAAKLVF